VTKGGKRFTADLVVAADGLHSMCRHIVVGQPSKPIPTGQMVYRVTVPAKRLVGIPELDEIRTVPRNNHWIGPHGTILSYLLEGINETLVNLVFTSVTPSIVETTPLTESSCDVRMPDGVNQQPGTADEVREAFKGWDPKIDRLLEFVSEVLEWRVCCLRLPIKFALTFTALHP
jgi:salicylate hydroxylase